LTHESADAPGKPLRSRMRFLQFAAGAQATVSHLGPCVRRSLGSQIGLKLVPHPVPPKDPLQSDSPRRDRPLES
jgi:hypothetical protein